MADAKNPIGFSDGTYFEDEWAQEMAAVARDAAANRLARPYLKRGGEEIQPLEKFEFHNEPLKPMQKMRPILDPVTNELGHPTAFDDSPTEAAQRREGSVFKDLKRAERDMEENLRTAGPDLPELPEPKNINMYRGPSQAVEILDRNDFGSIGSAKIRLGQLLRDKAATKKTGYDVDSSDYMHYNNAIRTLRDFIKKNQPE